MNTNILAISGSLRKDSINSALLRAFAQHASRHAASLEFASISLPLFNADVAAAGALDSVEPFQASIARSDAVLIATPEYNHSIPGVLKNALDWASRPAYKSVLRDKPVAVVSASPGGVGGARAQAHLKTILLGMASQVFPQPEFLMGGASAKMDQGEVTDPKTLEVIDRFLEAFVRWTLRVKPV